MLIQFDYENKKDINIVLSSLNRYQFNDRFFDRLLIHQVYNVRLAGLPNKVSLDQCKEINIIIRKDYKYLVPNQDDCLKEFEWSNNSFNNQNIWSNALSFDQVVQIIFDLGKVAQLKPFE